MKKAWTNLPADMTAIVRRVGQINKLNALLIRVLPDHLRHQCRVANWRNGVLVIACNNAAAATEVRFMQTDLLSQLRSEEQLFNLASIKVTIAPLQTMPTKPARPAQKPQHGHTISDIHAVADTINDEALRQALNRLGDTLES